MLNLIYYDLKATIKRLWVYIALMTVLSLLVRFIWSGIFTAGISADVNKFYIASIINVVALSALGVIALIVSIAVIVTQTKWFDENVLSPQGQLTNMLPVSSLQIMLSKVLTALFWSIIIVLMTIGVLSIFLFNTDRYDTLISSIIEIGQSNNVNISIAQIIFSASFFVATTVTTIVTMCFVAQLIGQIADDYRNFAILIGFIVLVVLYILFINVLGSIFGISVANLSPEIDSIINFAISSATKMSFINIIVVFIDCLIGSYILNNHLNLI